MRTRTKSPNESFRLELSMSESFILVKANFHLYQSTFSTSTPGSTNQQLQTQEGLYSILMSVRNHLGSWQINLPFKVTPSVKTLEIISMDQGHISKIVSPHTHLWNSQISISCCLTVNNSLSSQIQIHTKRWKEPEKKNRRILPNTTETHKLLFTKTSQVSKSATNHLLYNPETMPTIDKPLQSTL